MARYLVTTMADRDSNIVFVGKKPLMSYVLAAVMQLNGKEAGAAIKARGRAISRAVDVAEIVRNKFVNDAVLDRIQIGTEVLKNEAGKKTNVSFIEIYLVKPKAPETEERTEAG
jgi:DNA-binding protein